MSDMRKDHHPTQPPRVKRTVEPNRKEIRQEILEGDEFQTMIGDRFRDELSDPQSAMIAYYIDAREKAIRKVDMKAIDSYNASLASYVAEVLGPHVQYTLDWMVERYIERNFVPVEG